MTPPAAAPSSSKWFSAIVLAWLIPGAGHLLLKRPGRGALIALSVTVM
jgi:TM2 domain-containing membrane protein YozV